MSNSTSSTWVEIPLTKGLATKVDIEDAAVLRKFKWCASIRANTAYVVRGTYTPDGRRTLMYMHKFITGYSMTDHINGDGLDNRRCNLREASQAENNFNTCRRSDNSSGYKGVSWDAKGHRWRAYIRLDGHQRHIGYFPNSIDAAVAYDRAARRVFGEYATLNFPEPGERAA